MTPTERLLTIVRCLRDATNRGQRSLASTAIKERMNHEYEGAAGDRKWRRDIRILRERGLITTDLPSNRTGIALRVPPKPQRLHLTREEHSAINRARQALRPGVSAVSPLGAPTGGARLEVDEVTRILRFLEENGDEVEFAQLAQWLGVSERRVFELVDIFRREAVFPDGLVASVVIGYADEQGDPDEPGDPDGQEDLIEDPVPVSVSVVRGCVDAQSPTRWRGMDQLGFFPYALPETDDRLALIDEALSGDGEARWLAQELVPALRGARRKLLQWRSELQREEPMS